MAAKIHGIVDKCLRAMRLRWRRILEEQLQTDRVVCF